MRFDDPANSASWRTFTDTYDASGRRTTETGARDDNTGWVYSFDAANRATWNTAYFEYNVIGNASGVSVLKDNGDLVAVQFSGTGAALDALRLTVLDGAQLLNVIDTVVNVLVDVLSALPMRWPASSARSTACSMSSSRSSSTSTATAST